MPDANKINYHNILDSIKRPLLVIREDLTIAYCNPAFVKDIARSVNEIIGQKVFDLFPWAIGSSFHKQLMETLNSGVHGYAEEQIGPKFYKYWFYRSDEGVVIQADDTSIFKRWVQQISDFTNNQRAIFDEIDVALVIQDVNNDRIVDVNRTACEMFGYNRTEMLSLNMGALTADDPPYNREDFLRWLKTPSELKDQSIDWKARDKSGRVFWIEIKSKRMEIGNEIRILAVIKDITRRKYAEKELRDLNERYDALFENPGDIVFMHDLAGNFITVNHVMEKITGYWTEELLKMNIQQLASDDYLKLLRGFQYQRMQPGQITSYELEILDRHGNNIMLDVKISPVYSGGKPNAILGIARDITDYQIKEMQLKAEIERLNSFIDFLPDATMAINLEGKVVVWNLAMEELTGIKAQDMLGKGDYEYGMAFYNNKRPIMVDLVLRPEEVTQYYSVVEVDKYTIISEFSTPNLRGASRYLWGQAMPWYDREGNLIGAIESLRDVTERYKSRQELKDSQEKVKLDRRGLFRLIDNLEDAVTTFDINGVISLSNKKFSEIIGYSLEELPGMVIADILYDKFNEIFRCEVKEFLEANGEKGLKIDLKHKDGSAKPVVINILPMREEGKIVGGIMRVFEDYPN